MLGPCPSIVSRFHYLKVLLNEAEADAIQCGEVYTDALHRMETVIGELLGSRKLSHSDGKYEQLNLFRETNLPA